MRAAINKRVIDVERKWAWGVVFAFIVGVYLGTFFSDKIVDFIIGA